MNISYYFTIIMLKFYLKFEMIYFAIMRTECVIVLSFLNLRKYTNCVDVLFCFKI